MTVRETSDFHKDNKEKYNLSVLRKLVTLTGTIVLFLLVAAYILMTLQYQHNLIIDHTTASDAAFYRIFIIGGGLMSLLLVFLLGLLVMLLRKSDKAIQNQKTLIRESEEEQRLLFDYAVSAIGMYEIVFNRDGKAVDYIYLSVNPAFEQHTGLSVDQVTGRLATEVIPGIEKTRLIDTYGTVVSTGESVSFEYYFEPLKRHFFINAYRLDEKRFATVFTNITERVDAEIELFETERQYRIIVENSYDIIYRLDNEGLFTYLSPALKIILGYEPEQLIGQTFKAIVHPDDINVCSDFLELIRGSGTRQEGVEYRVLHHNGTWRWHTSCATPLLDDNHITHGFVGSARDITDHVEMQQELKNKKEQFELAIKGSNNGIWDWHLSTNELYLSPRWKEQLGYTDDEIPNEFASFESRIHPDDKERVFAEIDQYIKGDLLQYDIEFRMLHNNGLYRWIWSCGEALRDHNQKAYRMAGSHTDITEIIKEKNKMAYASFHDSLTGLFNRSYLYNLNLSESDYAVFSFDIDNLKYVNDTLGHHEGDQLILNVTAVIRHCFRESDIIVRMGGDEFIAVVEGCDMPEAKAIMKRILSNIAKQNEKEDPLDYSVGFSVGYAVSSPDNRNLEVLIKEADLMMYEAKRQKKKVSK